MLNSLECSHTAVIISMVRISSAEVARAIHTFLSREESYLAELRHKTDCLTELFDETHYGI